MTAMLVHFPWMHPRLGQGPLPEGLVFFDPGVNMDTDRPRWRPESLPCSPAEVRALLRSYMEFGERFARSSDMKAYQAAGLDNFFTGTSLEFRSQLLGGAEPEAADPCRQAQILLAMALFREEQFVAMREQEGRFEAAREGFASVLGLDDEESFAELGVPDEAIFPRASAELPWKSHAAVPAVLPAPWRAAVRDRHRRAAGAFGLGPGIFPLRRGRRSAVLPAGRRRPGTGLRRPGRAVRTPDHRGPVPATLTSET